jgi:hypothetical protein
LSERISPSCIENEDGGLKLERSQRATVIGNPQGFERDVGIARNARVDRNEIVFAFELHPITADIDERDRVGARARGFLHKVTKCVAQRILIEIASAHHVETRGLQRLCDQTRIVGGRVEGAGLIAGISDHQRDALFRMGRARRHEQSERD